MNVLISHHRAVSFVTDEYSPSGDEWVVEAVPQLRLEQYTPEIIANLIADPVAAQVFRVKVWVERLLQASRWRIERAEERDRLNIPGETVAEVVVWRESVRRASHRIEAAIVAADDPRAVPFEVLPEDGAGIPLPLSRRAFLRLCIGHGGLTPEQAVVSRADPALAFMWMLVEMVPAIERDELETREGLAALEALGYLPAGAQAVIDQWPTS